MCVAACVYVTALRSIVVSVKYHTRNFEFVSVIFVGLLLVLKVFSCLTYNCNANRMFFTVITKACP